VRRVESEEDARAFIASARSAHHDARHHCTAFVIGPDGGLQRSNDDGEPAGTAGRPMLEAICGRRVSDVAAVVTRWFGGTLLGAGGLVRAYGEVTGAALDAAGRRAREQVRLCRVLTDAATAGALDHRLRQAADVVDVDYGRAVTFTVATDDPQRLGTELAGWTAGAAQLEEIGSRWRDVPE